MLSLPEPGYIDVVSQLAVPLPVIVIAETLGVPATDRDRFKAWSTDVAASLGAPFQQAEALDKAQRSSNELADYFRDADRPAPQPSRATTCLAPSSPPKSKETCSARTS